MMMFLSLKCRIILIIVLTLLCKNSPILKAGAVQLFHCLNSLLYIPALIALVVGYLTNIFGKLLAVAQEIISQS